MRITPNLTLSAEHRRDLTADGGTLKTGFGIRYLDECFDLLAGYERSFTRDRDIEPSTSFILRVRLRHLGD